VYTAFETIAESTFAAPTSVNLRFNHNLGRIQFGGDSRRFLGTGRALSLRRGDAKFLKQFAGLILVDIHKLLGETR
jgi:hypothetical protein